MKKVVRAKNIKKSFGELEVIKNLSFEIEEGICFGMLGPNGAGKTTMIKALLGLSPFEDGELEVLGYEIPKDATKARSKIGVVPQNDNLDPEFTVKENLEIYGSYFKLQKSELKARILELLKFAELTHKANEKIQKLSGGMLRRLTVARALVHNPELIILDEPTTGLDPQVRHTLWDRLNTLRKSGKTLLLTTHYMDEAQRLCDEIIVIDGGKMLDRGSPKELIKRHIESEVVELKEAISSELQKKLELLEDIRLERYQDQTLCYTRDSKDVLKVLSAYSDIPILHRPANLEDVFLKLTGRELRE
ncbi:MAG: ATP-binding cassette domain-containing protein [Campylobacterales bacterium]